MKIDRKHMGLILASFIALSFNSHFAQAAKKTQEILQPAKVYAFKKTATAYVPLAEVKDLPVVVKKTGVRIDRRNLYIGGYVVNTSNKTVSHVRIFPTFVSKPRNSANLSAQLNHDELNLSPKETRRFVIMRPISEVKTLLENNVPVAENCVLNCRLL
ncbi:hypothetical protein KBA41_13120 [Candidatus Ozemobacteraceae bacterium]|nr:hypothetical protein [Candidatus Ozemobacteraceae bacterium]